MIRTTSLAVAVEEAARRGNGIHKIVRKLSLATVTYYYVILGGTNDEIRSQRAQVLATVRNYFELEQLVSYEFVIPT